MKPRTIKAMIRAKERIERGETAPARVWEMKPDGKGGFTRRALDPRAFQRTQNPLGTRASWPRGRSLACRRAQFARLLGISVRTLHHWEQGTRTPSGAARVLLRVAALNPGLVLKAAA